MSKFAKVYVPIEDRSGDYEQIINLDNVVRFFINTLYFTDGSHIVLTTRGESAFEKAIRQYE
jgi:hypothetical protein